MKVTPVMQYLRAHRAIVDRTSVFHYTGTQPPYPAVSMNLIERNNGSYLGRLVKYIRQYEKGRVSQTVYVNVGDLHEQREQEVLFSKILGKNSEKDKFLPEKITKTITYINSEHQLVRRSWVRIISSNLKYAGYDEKGGFNIYEASEPVKYFEKRID